MRLLLRILILWAICAPLFYFFGLPFLLDKLSAKARSDGFAQCLTHLREERLYDTPAALLKQEEAEHYCHCVGDGLILTKADLSDLIAKKPPARLQAAMAPITEQCNKDLQQKITDIINQAPQPRVTRDANGIETLHFDAPVHYKQGNDQ